MNPTLTTTTETTAERIKNFREIILISQVGATIVISLLGVCIIDGLYKTTPPIIVIIAAICCAGSIAVLSVIFLNMLKANTVEKIKASGAAKSQK